jgi:hypothetical protein
MRLDWLRVPTAPDYRSDEAHKEAECWAKGFGAVDAPGYPALLQYARARHQAREDAIKAIEAKAQSLLGGLGVLSSIVFGAVLGWGAKSPAAAHFLQFELLPVGLALWMAARHCTASIRPVDRPTLGSARGFADEPEFAGFHEGQAAGLLMSNYEACAPGWRLVLDYKCDRYEDAVTWVWAAALALGAISYLSLFCVTP